jgi:hypothetical protein
MKTTAKIIAGGGWHQIRKERIHTRAWLITFLTILLAGGALNFFDYLSIWGFVPSFLTMIAAIALFVCEKPTEVDLPVTRGDSDPRKLYSGTYHDRAREK